MDIYNNQIVNIIDNLRDERTARIKAYNSGCIPNKEVIGREIEILTKGILAMNNEVVLDILDEKIKDYIEKDNI